MTTENDDYFAFKRSYETFFREQIGLLEQVVEHETKNGRKLDALLVIFGAASEKFGAVK
ncbi:hypothetical protein [Ruegeria arenilitoris]|uniref:hypothetical protein n=1 Tax=Ruegeria arenilitoris TaxID=1173585 RepID=UPI0014804C3B|nr:hypothetical protein [Ruegeria arenilitoris]